MNNIMKKYYPTFELYQALREQLLDILSDEELDFQPGGDNSTLGFLCREIGEIEYSYIQSFKTFKQDFSYRNREAGLEGSVAQLGAWYEALDKELKTTIDGLSDKDLDRSIDRGGFSLRPLAQLDVYKEALLIFYGKVSVYLKTMGKTRPEQWVDWID
jgi:uncharacterized damage-inducible protein DinB